MKRGKTGVSQALHLNHLKVQRELQRRGIASLMIQGAMCLADRRGWSFQEIDLLVSSWNQNAMKFYSKMGFIPQARRGKRQRSALSQWTRMSKDI